MQPVAVSPVQKAECGICLQIVNTNSLLPCQQCHEAACVLCHLRSLAAKNYANVNDAVTRGASCPFCSTAYSQVQLVQLSVIHRDRLDNQPLFARDAHITAINAELDDLYRRTDTQIDDIRQREMQEIEEAHTRAYEQRQAATGRQFQNIMRRLRVFGLSWTSSERAERDPPSGLVSFDIIRHPQFRPHLSPPAHSDLPPPAQSTKQQVPYHIMTLKEKYLHDK